VSLRRLGPLLGAGAGASLLYLLTLGHTQGADALAYTDLSVLGHPHPQHLLHHALGWLALQPLSALAPQVQPLLWLSGLNALCGGLGIALAGALARRAGAAAGLTAAAMALLATSYGWWSLSTTAEVHALPVALQLAAVLALTGPALTAPTRTGGVAAAARPAWSGALHALAVLLHKTMVLGLPSLLLGASLAGWRQARALLLVAALGIGLPYGAVMARSMQRGDAWHGAATAWLLGEVAHFVPGAPPHLPWRVAASSGLAGSWVYNNPPRCGFRLGWSGEPLPFPGSSRLPWKLTQLGGLLGAGLALVGAAALARRDRALGLALIGWPLLSVATAFWFEPANYEYYLGALTCAVILAAVGASSLAERSPWPRPTRMLLGVAGLLTALLVGAHNLEVDLGPAMQPADGIQPCHAQAGPPQAPPPPVPAPREAPDPVDGYQRRRTPESR